MPITTTCPGCKALFRLPEELAGKQVRCQKCAQMFTVPMALSGLSAPAIAAPEEAPIPAAADSPPPQDDVILAALAPDEDEAEEVILAPLAEPKAAAKPAPPERPVSLAWTMALLVLFLVAMLATSAFASIWVATHLSPPLRVTSVPPLHIVNGGNQVFGFDQKKNDDRDFGQKDKDKEQKFPAAMPEQIFIGPLVNGRTEQAPFVDHGKWNKDGPYRLYRIHLKEGTTYNFHIKGINFEPRLRIFEDDGKALVAEGSGQAPHRRAMFSFQPKRTNDYLLWVTTRDGFAGNFFVQIAPQSRSNPVAVDLTKKPSYAHLGILRIEDPLDPTAGQYGPYRDYEVTLEADREYSISIEKASFPAVLRIDDNKVVRNEFPNPDNRLGHTFRPPNDGKYRIRVTSEGYGLGGYKLKIESKLAAKPEILHIPWFVAEQGFSAHLGQTGISSDGRLFFAAGDTGPRGALRLWDLATGKQVQELVLGGDPWFVSAQFLPGSKQLLTSYHKEKDIFLWDIAAGKVVRKFVGHDQPDPHFALAPDGKRLLSWNDDKTVRLWNVETGKELKTLEGHADKAAGVFSPDGKKILTFSPDKTLRLWSVETGKELKKLEGHTDSPIGCFAPDGKRALSYGPDQTIRLWDLDTGQEIRQFGDVLFKVEFAGFVANGRLVVANTSDLKFRVWEVASGKLVCEIDNAKVGAAGLNVTASPDGRLALVGHDNSSVRVLDLITGKEIQGYDNCRTARGFSFSPDGTLAVAGSFRQGVFVFRLPPR